MQQPEITPQRGGVELACFAIGELTLAVDLQCVREVARCPKITPLPQAPHLIEGVVELRERVVPVVDLGRAMLGRTLEWGPLARVAVVELDGLVFGLRVGSDAEVATLRASALEEAPALATLAGYEAIRAVVRRENAAPVLVISLEHLLERIYRSARVAGGD